MPSKELKIRDYSNFLTVEELNERLKKTIPKEQLQILGKSDEGHEILGARLGEGEDNALIFGFPHPNEPIGSLSCLELIKIIQKDSGLKKRFTWHIVPCADPDGAKMNEGWFKGSFSIKNYARSFFRQQPSKQLDWTFPITYKDYSFNKPPKQTKALQRLIDKYRPSFIYPLHNAGFGGAYFFLTKEMPEGYYKKVLQLCKRLGVPIDMGEAEAEYIEEFKKPFYKMFGLSEMYEYFSSNGKDPKKALKSGTDSIEYARIKNPGLFGIVTEIPYIYDKKIFCARKTKFTRRSLMEEKLRLKEGVYNVFDEVVRMKGIDKKNKFYALIEENLKMHKDMIESAKEELKKEEYSRLATEAEKFSHQVISRFYWALQLGQLRRLAKGSPKMENQKAVIKRIDSCIDEHASYVEKNSEYIVIPISDLIRFQIETLKITLDYI
jgi:gas vesicle protein